MITVRTEIDSFDNLYDMAWSQAKDNLKIIYENDLEDDLMEQLEEFFSDSDITDTELNDYLSYEFDACEFVAEHKNIDEIEDIDELEQYAKDLCFPEAKATIIDFTAADKEDLLWKYIQNNYAGYSLLEVMQELDGFESAETFEEE